MSGTRAAATRSASRCTGAAGSPASCAARRCAAPSPPAAPPCTARTASDDPGHHRQLRRRSAARRPGRRRARDARGAGARAAFACTPSPVAASTRLRSPARTGRAPLDFSLQLNRYPQILLARRARRRPRARRPRRRAALEAPRRAARLHRASHLPAGARAAARCKRLLNGVEARCLPRARRWCSRSRAPRRTRCCEMGIPASRIEVLSNGVDAVDLPGVEHEDGRVLFVEPPGAREGRARRDLGARRRSRQRSAGAAASWSAAAVSRPTCGARRSRAAGGSSTSGALDREALNREYARAAIVLMPSRFEGLGHGRARGAGGRDAGGRLRRRRPARRGRRSAACSSPAGDCRALRVAAVATCSTTAARRAEAGARGREVVLAEHSWDAIGAAPRGDLRAR